MRLKNLAFYGILPVLIILVVRPAVYSQSSVAVPDVLSKTAEEAKKELERAGLRWTVEIIAEINVECKANEGRVVGQSPARGTKVSLSTAVKIFVYQPGLTGFVVPGKKPTIPTHPRIQPGVIMKPSDVDLSVLGGSRSTLMDFGPTIDVWVIKKGLGEMKTPVLFDWTAVDANGNKIDSGRLSLPPEAISDYDKVANGVVQQPSAKFSIPEYLERWICKVLLRADPDNQVQETDENNNAYEFKFGTCQRLPAAGGTAGIDLIPEYDSSCLSAPDSYGNRKLMIRVANRGTQELRRPFKFKVYLRREGDLTIVAARELNPGDLPLKAGETKAIDPGFSIRQKDYESGTTLAVALDTDDIISEPDELNNYATYPFGLGQMSPESDLNARPDFVINFKEIKAPAKGCPDENYWNSPNLTDCLVKLTARIDNQGKAAGPKSGPFSVEISVTDKEGKEIYVDYKELNIGVAAGYNVLLDINITPLVYFMKACQIKLTVDPENKVQEEEEGNNAAVMGMPFCGLWPPVPDLRVNSLTAEKTSIAGKDAYKLTAECENAGNNVGNPTFGFIWYIDGEKYEYQGYLSLTGFGDFPSPLQKFTVTTVVPIEKFPAGTDTVRVRFEIDSRANVKESNWDNNIQEFDLKKY